MKGNIHL